MISAVLLLLLVGIPIAGTLAYGVYHRSDAYRRSVERDLTSFFGLPTTVREVRPYAFNARRLLGVEMWLPDRRARIFESPQVIWAEHEEAGGSVHIDIFDAELLIDSVNWDRDDYSRVLRASLAHNFGALDVQQVRYHGARFIWSRPDVRIIAEGVEGILRFRPDGRGDAQLTCRKLNGASATEPIQISALIDPHTSELLPEVSLDIPRLALDALELSTLLESEVTQGTFSGNVHLRQSTGEAEVELSGTIEDVRLEEFTGRLPNGPYPARVDLDLKKAILRQDRIVALRFDGEIDDIDVDSILGRWELPGVGGKAKLTVHNGRVEDNQMILMLADGQWEGASLENLCRALFHRDGIDGELLLTIRNVKLDADGVAGGDVLVEAAPRPGQVGYVNRDFVAEFLDRYLGASLPRVLTMMLPEEIEYEKIGARLWLGRDAVRVFAAPGPAGRALVTLRFQDRQVPLLGNLDVTLPMAPWIERIQGRVAEMKTRMRDRLRRDGVDGAQEIPP